MSYWEGKDEVCAWVRRNFDPDSTILDVGAYDIRNFRYQWYDLVIFGDVIEHMTPEDAREVLDYAKPRCRDMIISVPFLYKQDAIYGNPYEVHVQDDLTERLFNRRYPGYSVLCKPRDDYCYYHKKEE